MAQVKPEEVKLADEQKEDHWARYFSIQLTPEQVAENRAELQKDIERARATGVYEGLLRCEGKVHWDIDIDELREDREFDSD